MKNIKKLSLGLFIFLAYVFLGGILIKVFPGLWGVFVWHLSGIAVGVLYLNRNSAIKWWQGSFFPTGKQIFIYSLLLVLVWIVGQSLAFSIIENVGDSAFGVYQDRTGIDPGLYVIISLIVAPISEEYIFRGLLYRSIRDNTKYPLISAIITSWVFCFAHGTLVHLFVGFALSLLSIMVYERTCNIKYSIITHMLHNFLATGLSGIIPVTGFMYNLNIMISVACFVVLLLLYLLFKTYKMKETLRIKRTLLGGDSILSEEFSIGSEDEFYGEEEKENFKS